MFFRPGRGSLSLACALGAAATVCVATTFAQSERVPITLEWRASACASSREVLDRVAVLLGGEAVASKPVDARASAEPAARGRMRVTVTTRIDGREGERAIEVASCAEAVQAAALVVALAVDPARVAAHQAEVASTEAGTAAPPLLGDAAPAPATTVVRGDATLEDAGAPLADASPAREPSPAIPREAANAGDASAAESETVAWSAYASALVDVGTLPKLAGGAAVGLGVQHSAWRAEVAFHALLPQSTDDRTRGGSFGVLGGEARGCALPWRAGIELGPCIIAEGERISASGRNVATPLDESAGVFSLGVGPMFTVPLASTVRLRLAVDALAPFVRPSFVVQLPTSTVEVHRVGAVAIRGAAGLVLTL